MLAVSGEGGVFWSCALGTQHDFRIDGGRLWSANSLKTPGSAPTMQRVDPFS